MTGAIEAAQLRQLREVTPRLEGQPHPRERPRVVKRNFADVVHAPAPVSRRRGV